MGLVNFKKPELLKIKMKQRQDFVPVPLKEHESAFAVILVPSVDGIYQKMVPVFGAYIEAESKQK
jgi:hypothetical protein